MIHEVNSNLLTHPLDGLVQSCNAFNCFGAGLALALSNKYPELEAADNKTIRGDKNKMGTFSWVKLHDGKVGYNLYGQYSMGYGKHTDYDAIEKGLVAIESHAKSLGIKKLGLPGLMGCGLGGGDWNVVKPIIEKVFKDSSIDLYICTYVPGK